jgi:hypothetical protein
LAAADYKRHHTPSCSPLKLLKLRSTEALASKPDALAMPTSHWFGAGFTPHRAGKLSARDGWISRYELWSSLNE